MFAATKNGSKKTMLLTSLRASPATISFSQSVKQFLPLIIMLFLRSFSNNANRATATELILSPSSRILLLTRPAQLANAPLIAMLHVAFPNMLNAFPFTLFTANYSLLDLMPLSTKFLTLPLSIGTLHLPLWAANTLSASPPFALTICVILNVIMLPSMPTTCLPKRIP